MNHPMSTRAFEQWFDFEVAFQIQRGIAWADIFVARDTKKPLRTKNTGQNIKSIAMAWSRW